jgi:hypothetical protein
MHGWNQYGFDKKSARTHYAKRVFLHQMGSTGHVVHSAMFRARNVITLFFMFGWDHYGFDKKHSATRNPKLVFLHPMGSMGHVG